MQRTQSKVLKERILLYRLHPGKLFPMPPSSVVGVTVRTTPGPLLIALLVDTYKLKQVDVVFCRYICTHNLYIFLVVHS